MIIELPDPPEGWMLTHLIFLDPCWQANLKDDEHTVVASGDTPTEAVEHAIEKIFLEQYAGRYYFPKDLLAKPKVDARSLLENLGLLKPAPPILRRMGL